MNLEGGTNIQSIVEVKIIPEDGLLIYEGQRVGEGLVSGGAEHVQFLKLGHDFMSVFNLQPFIKIHMYSFQFSHSVVPDSLQPHESQHARLPCPSQTPGVYSKTCPLNR